MCHFFGKLCTTEDFPKDLPFGKIVVCEAFDGLVLAINLLPEHPSPASTSNDWHDKDRLISEQGAIEE